MTTTKWTTYSLEGKALEQKGDLTLSAPIGYIIEETKDYSPGWYFLDEEDRIHGPFNTYQEVTETHILYCEMYDSKEA